ncbi:type II secretion system GspH family protein [Patescibacteria group bacterium]|nr:type II secretion system GspH family protein [Patescibacteria group bacterium]MBU4453160.1 type II secretion system GspH family protein [Patescibacteria group bacterium]MCG2687591.1 type II secretion system GspH family protein [Candidatus Parcubacteria bacterium]
MNKPRGYTIIELLGSMAIVAFLIIIVVMMSGPKDALKDEYRNAQLSDVNDYMQSLLLLQLEEESRFYELALIAQDQKVMIGIGEGCDGSFGSQCTDDELSDACLNIEEFLPAEYSELLPYDSSSATFSRVRTGYYIFFKDNILEVGACAPSGIDPVRLMSLVK